MLDRLWVSLVAIPIVVAVVWFDVPWPWFTLLAVVWGMGGAHEFYSHLKRSKGLSPLTIFGLLWVGLLIASPSFYPGAPFSAPYFAGSALLITTAVLIFAFNYFGAPGQRKCLCQLVLDHGRDPVYRLAHQLPGGIEDRRGRPRLVISGGILCTFASDSSAYLAGRALGKHKMAPFISP